MPSSSLELKNVVKMYQDVLGVGPVSFSAQKGEFIALLGPSGCGKTTTLRCIAGLERPNQGDIIMDGERINDKPVHQREIGFVFQDYALFPHMTVAENVGFGLRFRSMDQDKKQKARLVEEALELVNLHGLGKRYPSQLSGGQQQRVALARAIVIRPRVLLLDEPLSNIDAALRQRMQIELKNLQHRIGVTSIHVTHDQQEAFTLADRVALFNQGALVQIGPPDELYESPSDMFVAEFIGDTNFIEGQVQTAEKAPLFKTKTGLNLVLEPDSLAPPLDYGQPALASIRPQRVRLEGVDDLSGDNIITGYVEQKINMGDLYRFVVRIGSSADDPACAQGKGVSLVIKKYNTRASREISATGFVRIQLHPADLKPLPMK